MPEANRRACHFGIGFISAAQQPWAAHDLAEVGQAVGEGCTALADSGPRAASCFAGAIAYAAIVAAGEFALASSQLAGFCEGLAPATEAHPQARQMCSDSVSVVAGAGAFEDAILAILPEWAVD